MSSTITIRNKQYTYKPLALYLDQDIDEVIMNLIELKKEGYTKIGVTFEHAGGAIGYQVLKEVK